MELEPTLPRPQGRSEAWAQDLSYAARKLTLLDRSLTPATRKSFRRATAQLEANAATFDDPHIMVGLAEAVALADNAHTRLYLVRNRTEVRQYPIRVWWFHNELRVIRAAPEHADLLGCEVTKIGAHSIADLRSRVAPLYAGSRSWGDYISTYTLTSPEILYGLNAIPAMGKAQWTFHCPGGVRSLELDPLPLRKTDKAVEAWWDLAPHSPDSNGDFASVTLASVPLYLRHPDQNYWFDRQDELGLLYFQFNRAADQGDESLRDFGVRLEGALRDAKVRAFVVDLRFNTGGNLDLGRELMEHLQAAAAGRKVYVITGRATFSAGIFHAAQWKQWGKATFVGEPVGDGLDFWSEGGNITLPNSGLLIHFANAFHSYSRKEYPDRKPYFEDLSIDSLTPDQAASPTFDDYLSGRDPALDLVVSRLGSARAVSSTPNLAKPHQFR